MNDKKVTAIERRMDKLINALREYYSDAELQVRTNMVHQQISELAGKRRGRRVRAGIDPKTVMSAEVDELVALRTQLKQARRDRRSEQMRGSKKPKIAPRTALRGRENMESLLNIHLHNPMRNMQYNGDFKILRIDSRVPYRRC